MRSVPLLALATLTLAACNSGANSSQATATPSESAAPTPTPTPLPTTIPSAFQGRWGLVPDDCTSTRGDAKGLLTIDDTTLKFYESVGKLGTVEESLTSRFRATFDFTGEGMTWSRDEAFDLRDAGKTLVRRELGEDATPGAMAYTRCA